MDNIQIEDDSGDRKYFTMVPNYILNHSTATAQALYLQLKRLAGERGIAYPGRRYLMERLGISYPTLKKEFQYLLNKGWIQDCGYRKVNTDGGPQDVRAYKIVDLWEMNVKHYQGSERIEPPLLQRGEKIEPQGVKIRGEKIEPKEKPPEEKLSFKKNITAEQLKEIFFSHPQFPTIKAKYPDRDYAYQFALMCDWWITHKKKLPVSITALANWLRNTKPDPEIEGERKRRELAEDTQKRLQAMSETPKADQAKIDQLKSRMAVWLR